VNSKTPNTPSAATLAVSPAPTGVQRRRVANSQFASRRDEIVDLAAHPFATKGYAATGIRDIGEAAQLARGALYYYIESKESLLGEIPTVSWTHCSNRPAASRG
jgi:hypothetical protein